MAAESLFPHVKLRGLYAITPEGGDVERSTRLALEGGIALLQYRQKRRDVALARAAVQAGADYDAFGSVFPSPTKPQAVRAPLGLFKEARALGVPLAAIGGITLASAPQLIAAGADLVAVISDLFEARDIRQRARDYGKLFA